MKTERCVSSSQARDFLIEQIQTWPLARENYRALASVKSQSYEMGGFVIRTQFNPARIVSSGAKVDTASIQQRRCFLCPSHLPTEQIRLPFGTDYLILCNPFPIFPEHFTVPTCKHTDQQIKLRVGDLMKLSCNLNDFTIFYNGPKSGASAPDHMHFQAVSSHLMPIDDEIEEHLKKYGKTILEEPDGRLLYFTQYLRNGFAIETKDVTTGIDLFRKLYHALPIHPGETEPAMNIFCRFVNQQWRIIIIPRRQHRPWQYDAEGEERLLLSPGAADIGGLFIIPIEKDFNRITPTLIQNVYQQVCFQDIEIEKIAEKIDPA